MSENFLTLGIHLPENGGLHTIEVSANTPISAVLKSLKQKFKLNNNYLELFLLPYRPGDPGRWLNKAATFASESVYTDSVLNLCSRHRPHKVLFPDGSSKTISLNSSSPIKENIFLICQKSGLTPSPSYSLFLENNVPLKLTSSLETQLVPSHATLKLGDRFGSYHIPVDGEEYLTSQDLHFGFTDHQVAVLNSFLLINDTSVLVLAAISLYISIGPYDTKKHSDSFLDDKTITKILPRRSYYQFIPLVDKSFKNAYRKLKLDILMQYSLLHGTSDELKLKYIQICQKSDWYGRYFHPCYIASIGEEANVPFLGAIYDHNLHLVNMNTLKFHSLIPIDSIKQFSLVDSILELVFFEKEPMVFESNYSIQLWIDILKEFPGTPDSVSFLLKGKTPISIKFNMDLIGSSTRLGNLKKSLESLHNELSVGASKSYTEKLSEIAAELKAILEKTWEQELKTPKPVNNRALHEDLHSNYYTLYYYLMKLENVLIDGKLTQILRITPSIMRIFLQSASIITQGVRSGDQLLHSLLSHMVSGVQRFIQLCRSILDKKNAESRDESLKITSKIRDHVIHILHLLPPYYLVLPGKLLHFSIIKRLDLAIDKWCELLPNFWVPYTEKYEKVEYASSFNNMESAIRNSWNTLKEEVLRYYPWIIDSGYFSAAQIQIGIIKSTLSTQLRKIKQIHSQLEMNDTELKEKLNSLLEEHTLISHLIDHLNWTGLIYFKSRSFPCTQFFQSYFMAFRHLQSVISTFSIEKVHYFLSRTPKILRVFLKDIEISIKTNNESSISTLTKNANNLDSPSNSGEEIVLSEELRKYHDSIISNITKIEVISDNPNSKTLVEIKEISHDIIFQITNLLIYLHASENNNKRFVDFIMMILCFISEFMSDTYETNIKNYTSSKITLRNLENSLNKNITQIMKNLLGNNFFKYFLEIIKILPKILLFYESNTFLPCNEWNFLQQKIRILKVFLNPQIQLMKLIQTKYIVKSLNNFKKNIRKAEKKLQTNNNNLSPIEPTSSSLKQLCSNCNQIVLDVIKIYHTIANNRYNIDIQSLLRNFVNSALSLTSVISNYPTALTHVENIIFYMKSFFEIYSLYLNNNNTSVLWELSRHSLKIIQQVDKLYSITNERFYNAKQISSIIRSSIPLLSLIRGKYKLNLNRVFKDFSNFILHVIIYSDAHRTNNEFIEQHLLSMALKISRFGQILSKLNSPNIWFKFGIKSEMFIKNYAKTCEYLFVFIARFIIDPSEHNLKVIINTTAHIFNNLPVNIAINEAENYTKLELFKHNHMIPIMCDDLHILKSQLQKLILGLPGWNSSPGLTLLNLNLIFYFSQQLTHLLHKKLIPNNSNDTFSSIANEFWQLSKSLKSNLSSCQLLPIFMSTKSLILKLENFAQEAQIPEFETVTNTFNDAEVFLYSVIQNDTIPKSWDVYYNQIYNSSIDLLYKISSQQHEKSDIHFIFTFMGLFKELVLCSFRDSFETNQNHHMQVYSLCNLDLIDQITTQQKIRGYMWLNFFQKTVEIGQSAFKELCSTNEKQRISPLKLSSILNIGVLQILSSIKQIFKFDNVNNTTFIINVLQNLNPEMVLSNFQSQVIIYLTILNLEDRLPKPNYLMPALHNFYSEILKFLGSLSTGNDVEKSYKNLTSRVNELDELLTAELVPESVILINNFLNDLQKLKHEIESLIEQQQEFGNNHNNLSNSNSWKSACELGHNIFQCFNSIFQDFLSPASLEVYLNKLFSYLRPLCFIILSCGQLYSGSMNKEITSYAKAIINKFSLFMESMSKAVKCNSSTEDLSFPFSQASRSISVALNIIKFALDPPQEFITKYLMDLCAKVDSVLFSYETGYYPSNDGCWHDSFGDQYLKNLKNIESLLLTSNAKNSLECIKSGPDLLNHCWDSLSKILPFAQLFPISMNVTLLNYFRQLVIEFLHLIVNSWPTESNDEVSESITNQNGFNGRIDDDIIRLDGTKEILKKNTIIETGKMTDYRKAMNYSNSNTSTSSQDNVVSDSVQSNNLVNERLTWDDVCKRVSVLYQYSTQYVDQISWVWRLMKNFTLEMIEHGAQAVDQLNTLRVPNTDVDIELLEEKISRICCCFELTWDRQYHFGSFEISRKEMGINLHDKNSNSKYNKELSNSDSKDSSSDMQRTLNLGLYRFDEFEKETGLGTSLRKQSISDSAEIKNNNVNVTISPCSELVFIHASAFRQSLKSFEKLISNLIKLLQVTPIIFKKILKHRRQGVYNEFDNSLVFNTSTKLANQLNKVTESCMALINAIKLRSSSFKTIFSEFRSSIVSLFQTLRRLSFPVLFFELEDINSMVLTENTQCIFFNWCSEVLMESRVLLSQSSKDAGQQLFSIQKQSSEPIRINNLINAVKNLTASGRSLLAATSEIQRVNLKLNPVELSKSLNLKKMVKYSTSDINDSAFVNRDSNTFVSAGKRSEDSKNSKLQKFFNKNESTGKTDAFNKDRKSPSYKVIKELVTSCASSIVSISFLLKYAANGQNGSLEHLNAAFSALNASLSPIANLHRVFIGTGGSKLEIAIKEITEASELLIKTAISAIEENPNNKIEENSKILDMNNISSKKAELEQRVLVQESQKILDENREILKKMTSRKTLGKTSIPLNSSKWGILNNNR